MSYEVALNKAWEGLIEASDSKTHSVRFLADEYTVNTVSKQVLSLSCNVPTKDFTTILILHYLMHKLRGPVALTGAWLNFRELAGVEGYFTAFHKRAVEPIVRKYGRHPLGIISVLERLPGTRAEYGDIGIIINAFEDVPVLIELWKGDEEFQPDANILFDKSVTGIFCTEDIIVLAGLVAAAL